MPPALLHALTTAQVHLTDTTDRFRARIEARKDDSGVITLEYVIWGAAIVLLIGTIVGLLTTWVMGKVADIQNS